MGERTGIEWCDHTFNPWRGCTRVSSGCANCYAEALAKRNPQVLGAWGPAGTRVVAAESYWRLPIKWNAAAAAAGVRRRVFCSSLADVFEDWKGPMVDVAGGRLSHVEGACEIVETMASVRRRLFALIDSTAALDWLLVTKRPHNVLRMWPSTPGVHPSCPITNYEDALASNHRPNVCLLASAENQETYDQRAADLWQCRHLCPVLGWSLEPLIGPLSLWNEFDGRLVRNWSGCWKWIIAGGESGPQARPCHPDWVRDLREQCQAAAVPFFFKQWGEWIPVDEYSCFVHGMNPGDYEHRLLYRDGTDRPDPSKPDLPTSMYRVGKRAAGKTIDGREWTQFPKP